MKYFFSQSKKVRKLFQKGQNTRGREKKNRVTINMWMLLNKQVLKRQSTAFAQNEAATIKCLGQDVHQSVVFQKNPKQI